MSKVNMKVGGAIEKESARRFIDARHRAENGDTFRERHLAFESWDALARVLTGKRMQLLQYGRRHKVTSVRALAKALGRDYSNVHADVQALTAAGTAACVRTMMPSKPRSQFDGCPRMLSTRSISDRFGDQSALIEVIG